MEKIDLVDGYNGLSKEEINSLEKIAQLSKEEISGLILNKDSFARNLQKDFSQYKSENPEKNTVHIEELVKKIFQQLNVSFVSVDNSNNNNKEILDKEAENIQEKQEQINKNLKIHNIKINSIKEQIKIINETVDSRDIVVGVMEFFDSILSSEDTPTEMLEKMYNEVVQGTDGIVKQIQEDIEKYLEFMSKEQKQEYEKTITEIQEIGESKINGFNPIKATYNSIKNSPEYAKQALYGAKGIAIGAYESGKVIIEGALDLSIFLTKYAGSFFTDNKEYRAEINEQCSQIREVIKNIDKEQIHIVFDIMGKEMDRIMSLPSEQQAEEIGKFAGNVIINIAPIAKGVTAIDKYIKAREVTAVARSAGIVEKAALNVGKAGVFILHGPAEKLIGEGLKKSFVELGQKLKGIKGTEKHIEEINALIKEFEREIAKSSNQRQINALQDAINQMNSEKQIILQNLRNTDNRSLLSHNGRLNIEGRISETNKLLGRELSQTQQKAIKDAYEIGKGKTGSYTTTELIEQTRILHDAGISTSERTIIMQNGLIGDASRMIDIPRLYSKLKQIEQSKVVEKLREADKIIEQIKKGFQKIDEFTDRSSIIKKLKEYLKDITRKDDFIHDLNELANLNRSGTADMILNKIERTMAKKAAQYLAAELKSEEETVS